MKKQLDEILKHSTVISDLDQRERQKYEISSSGKRLQYAAKEMDRLILQVKIC